MFKIYDDRWQLLIKFSKIRNRDSKNHRGIIKVYPFPDASFIRLCAPYTSRLMITRFTARRKHSRDLGARNPNDLPLWVTDADTCAERDLNFRFVDLISLGKISRTYYMYIDIYRTRAIRIRQCTRQCAFRESNVSPGGEWEMHPDRTVNFTCMRTIPRVDTVTDMRFPARSRACRASLPLGDAFKVSQDPRYRRHSHHARWFIDENSPDGNKLF